jgi:ABC-type transport system substrate-binding protein
MSSFGDYWGEPAPAETLVFRWGEEASQRAVDLQTGAVDGIDKRGPDDFETIGSDQSLQLIPREAFNFFYVGIAFALGFILLTRIPR